MTGWQPEPSRKTTRWLSREAAELFADARRCAATPDGIEPAFDVLVIGSGYGGAIAAAELAGWRAASGQPARIALIERGREYLPGAFPSQLSELPTQLRGGFANRRRGGEGLFDIRADGDLGVVQANGLGGGSLINAGVMEAPRPEVFDARWPQALRGGAALAGCYDEARRMLGAVLPDGRPNRIDVHAAHGQSLPAKTRVLCDMAPQPDAFRLASLTVAMRDGPSAGGVQLHACKRCGDCVTGCNHGAKESLDTNLLVRAAQGGVEIWCGATALRLQRPRGRGECWAVQLAHTDERLALREAREFWVGARRVILAAGSLGSTEILLRTRETCADLKFSAQLGRRFSGNGDSITFGYGYGDTARANAVADEDQPPGQREIGPTITGLIHTQAGPAQAPRKWPIVIEEMAVPGALRRAAEEVITTADVLRRLDECDRSPHVAGHPPDDGFAVHRERIRDMSIFAAMGDDGAGGQLRLSPGGERAARDGQIDIVWPELRTLPLFDAQVDRIGELARGAKYRGRTLANPLWRPLPERMARMLGLRDGTPVTVHPLGGCPMADRVADGVVDDCGRVYDAGPVDPEQSFHDGLYVLDGAILPCALGINPALTIAAVALRAVRVLRSEWQWRAPAPETPAAAPPLVRPILRDVEHETRSRAARSGNGTVVGISERLSGAVFLRDRRGIRRRCRVELTLSYTPKRLSQLYTPDAAGRLSAASLDVRAEPASATRLRIFLHDEWERIQKSGLDAAARERLEAAAARSYELSGTLTLLQRAPSRAWRRVLCAGLAWAGNRGVRDVWRSFTGAEAAPAQGWRAYISGLIRLASRAGEIRCFDYALRIGAEIPGPTADAGARFDAGADLVGGAIVGGKRIRYTRQGNPWRQLQELRLSEFAGRLARPRSAVLALDPRYFAERSHPLLRIEAQRDHVEALADLASLAAYVLRMMLSIHVWNTRKPDPPTPRRVQRLPGALPGLPEPQRHWIEVDRLGAQPVQLCLTRYRSDAPPAGAPTAPVLLIHGYSASGTSFAHPALKPGLARDLARDGRDVWVADLRSSAGLPTATQPWTMEQVGLTDIPAAVDFIWQRTGRRPIDVVAHCMGAVMLSMAVLSARKTADELVELLRPRGADPASVPIDRFAEARRALPQRLRRVVLSQNGPVMVMSQQNVFRAYVMSYIEALFGPLRYDFRPDAEPGLAMQLFDRLLAGLPYPDEDLRRENNPRVWRHLRFVGTRHRMDALYGRTFSLKNLDDEVLEHIDDLFGPLSLDTVAQVIHFARLETIASRAGRNRFVSAQALRECWTFPTLAVHGTENGLADIATLYRFEAVMKAAGRDVRIQPLEGQGHQDSLIGTRSLETFAHIRRFLDADAAAEGAAPMRRCFAQPPAFGPILGLDAQQRLHAGIGTSPRLGAPQALCVLPIERVGERWEYAGPLRRLGMTLAQTLQPVPAGGEWFAFPLPAWTRTVPRTLLLFIYASSAAPTDAELAAAVAAALGRLAAGARDERLGCIETGAAASPTAPLRLALGSCGYPPGIFNHVPAADAWRRLNARLDRGAGPHLLLLTGDQVYVDATAGLFDPVQAHDRFARPHEAWLHDTEVRDALRRVPALTLPDDHEIDDNWQPVAGRPGDPVYDANERLRRDGIAHFERYQRPAGPAPGRGGGDQSLQFDCAGVRLFMLDTRTQRRLRSVARPDAPMLDELQQWPALRRWLLDPAYRDVPKLIVSPAALLPRHRRATRARPVFGPPDTGVHAALRADGWDGYPDTFYRLLALIAEHRIPRVVFLSGDEHLGLLAEARLRGPRHAPGERGVRLLSIHTPGLNTPYRFANAQEADFILRERFRFASAGNDRYACALRTETFSGAGFTWITLERDGKGWSLVVEFDDGSGSPGRRRRFDL
ncbi:alpha/beta fold hydrolase [Fontimonas sp. SYSU GA230001]|uniref:alpha/beta fold hydrolase n=1 Tax=Fontimonas sp. SYSU GA230001 TaxID=3142450 RepID=UPI0032B3D096